MEGFSKTACLLTLVEAAPRRAVPDFQTCRSACRPPGCGIPSLCRISIRPCRIEWLAGGHGKAPRQGRNQSHFPAGIQRIHLHHVIGTGPQTDQPGDDEIAVGGMVVILATLHPAFRGIPIPAFPCFQPRAGDPIAGERVQVLIDPRNDRAILALQPVGVRIGFSACRNSPSR